MVKFCTKEIVEVRISNIFSIFFCLLFFFIPILSLSYFIILNLFDLFSINFFSLLHHFNPNLFFNSTHCVGSYSEYIDFGDKDLPSEYCGVLFWIQERVSVSIKCHPRFSACYMHGIIKLPRSRPTPPFLNNLLNLNNGFISKTSCNNVRVYNSMFAFTSMEARIDHSVNDKPYSYVFKTDGQSHHLMGSPLPLEGEQPNSA